MLHTTSDKKFRLVRILSNNEGRNPEYDDTFAEYDDRKIKTSFFKRSSEPWYKQYWDLLPLTKGRILSLGEGNTPLVSSKVFPHVYIKDEGRNPSGCFKDREHAVLIPYLHSQGKKKFILASSGNAALSASLYGRLYGDQVTCVIPKRTSIGKKNLIKAYGGEIVIGGEDYEECYRSVMHNKKYKGYTNISAGAHFLKDQGNKIIAFEIYEKIGIPDAVIIPSANGCLLAGIYLGFREIQHIAKKRKMPQLIAVQMHHSDPLGQALQRDIKDFYVYEDADLSSLAEGLVAKESYSAPKALHALRETDGFVCTVMEKELLEGMRHALEREGLLPEWTAASGFAALLTLKKNKDFNNKKIVIINTGNGLKEIQGIVKWLKK